MNFDLVNGSILKLEFKKKIHFYSNRTNYGYSFFQQFHLVLNALENRLDRDHVNVMCLRANVPVIDCYECASQEPTTIEIIQDKPTGLMHCVTWTLHLF